MKRLALITGGTGAIGAATAELLAPDHDLALVYRDDHTRARAVKERLNRAFPGVNVCTIAQSLKDFDSSALALEQIKQQCGRSPEVLITLSGGLCDALYLGSEFSSHEALLAEHLIVPMAFCHLLLGDMYKNRFGRIVNVGSISSSYIKRGQASYSTAKAGIEAFTKSIALEVAHRGITANVVAPGLIDSSFSAEYISKLHRSTSDLSRRIPAGYIGSPVDVAHLIRFLCTEESRYITGCVYRIDGGRSLGDPAS
jgi:NAD(P)-dependent dehydrogenase (short-subunit alcohol dehydrogenase family)